MPFNGITKGGEGIGEQGKMREKEFGRGQTERKRKSLDREEKDEVEVRLRGERGGIGQTERRRRRDRLE